MLVVKISIVNSKARDSALRVVLAVVCTVPAAPTGFRFWGNILGVGLVGGPGADPPPPDAGEFSKIFKKFIKKIEKYIILAYVSKN